MNSPIIVSNNKNNSIIFGNNSFEKTMSIESFISQKPKEKLMYGEYEGENMKLIKFVYIGSMTVVGLYIMFRIL